MSTLQDRVRGEFGSASQSHFVWQTTSPMVAEREAQLVHAAFQPLGKRILDVGCGEGATLYHLGGPEGAVGIDLFEAKLAFARSRLPQCTFVAASAEQLPFPTGSFDHVLVRDVIHHLDEPARLVDECRRVLTTQGRIDVLEPCRYNPLIFMHAVAKPAERGELRSTMTFLKTLLSRRFDVIETSRHQALPLHRLVLHPDIGWPGLARNVAGRALVDGMERLAGSIVPRPMWAYLHVRASAR